VDFEKILPPIIFLTMGTGSTVRSWNMNKSHLNVASIMSTTIWTGIVRKHCLKLQRNHNRYKVINHVNGKHIKREETKKDKPIVGLLGPVPGSKVI